MESSGCIKLSFWLGLLSALNLSFSLSASEVLRLSECQGRQLKPQKAVAGNLYDFELRSKSELLYPIVQIEWTSNDGQTYREEQKISQIRGGQNFFTLSVPQSFKAKSVRMTLNEQHCFQSELLISGTVVADSQEADPSLFFSMRPNVGTRSMLGLSLLLSFALLVLIPRRKYYFFTRKLALPD